MQSESRRAKSKKPHRRDLGRNEKSTTSCKYYLGSGGWKPKKDAKIMFFRYDEGRCFERWEGEVGCSKKKEMWKLPKKPKPQKEDEERGDEKRNRESMDQKSSKYFVSIRKT